MKIGALMVSEQRAPIWGIGLASYLTQTHLDAFLLALVDPIDDYIYGGTFARLIDSTSCAEDVLVTATRPKHVRVEPRSERSRGPATVAKLLDDGAQRLFDYGCDVVAIFDDDDWSPPDRLARTAQVFAGAMRAGRSLDKLPLITSYTEGRMVNLRTFEGFQLDLFPWGSTLAFNRFAWLLADGFAPGSCPGYDQAFVRRAVRRGATLLPLLPPAEPELLPINFCHGKNVASFAAGAKLEDRSDALAKLPPLVLGEVLLGQQFLVSRRVFPPGSGDGGAKV